MTLNEDKKYYLDSEGNIYDESCKIKPEWEEKTWDEIQELLEAKNNPQ